jgi:hypothetical protein
MTSEESRPDTPFQALPFQAHGGFGYDTHAQAIGQTIGVRERRFAVDPMGLSPGFRQGLESLNRGKIDKVDLEFKITAMFQRQRCRPHRCLHCGSGNHAKHACVVEEVRCIYPRCLSDEHNISVCPEVINRCTGCQRLGHRKKHHHILFPVLYNDFLAAAPFHGLAIFTCERLSVSMDEIEGEFVVVPKIDLGNDKYFSKNDRRRLSSLTYDNPY